MIYGLILIITISWLLSLRPVRLKIGDCLFEQGEFVPAIKWYKRVITKDRFNITQGEDVRLSFDQDLSRFRSLSISVIEHALFNIGKFLGFKSDNLTLLLKHQDHIFNSIDELIRSRKHFDFVGVKRCLLLIKYMYNIQEITSKQHPLDLENDYHASLFYLFMGVIDEMESHFLSAYFNYEKAAKINNLIFAQVEERKKLIVFAASNEYFIKSPYIRKLGQDSIVLQSETPLVIKGVFPNVDNNYLLYENCPVNILVQQFSKPKLRIVGEVLGGNRESCIIPRIVFWGQANYNGATTGEIYLGESSLNYPVQGKFEINYQFCIPPKSALVTPRITFHNLCFSGGKRIVINEVKWN